MSALSAAALLDVWEQGRDASPGERGLLLLAAAEPQVSPRELAAWSVGQRDGALLALREHTFGPLLAGLASCPQCDETLELAFPVSAITVPAQRAAGALSLAHEGYSLSFRLPTAGDLAALNQVGAAQAPERWLLERCVVDARLDNVPQAAAGLPDTVLEAMSIAMAEADPQAEVELALSCPACSARWRALFDIVSFLWLEVDARARRLLHEVHVLASTYGWAEQDILALSPQRRRHYLELIGE